MANVSIEIVELEPQAAYRSTPTLRTASFGAMRRWLILGQRSSPPRAGLFANGVEVVAVADK